MRIGVSVVLTIALSGCASPVWYRANTSQAQFEKDKSYCEYEAMKFGGGYDPTMETAIGQGIALGMRRNELGMACMRQLGYSQQQGGGGAYDEPIMIPDSVGRATEPEAKPIGVPSQ